jgi:multidrug efflux pump subunit AcrA (membrane-fusion protein)
MRRPALITVALAALAAAAVVGAVVVVGSPASTSTQERTATVARGVIQATVSGSGNLEPANEADVDFATSGEITHVYVKEGQHVSEDEILAKIDPDAANVELAQAEADLQSAQDALDQAEEAESSTTTTTATAAQSSGSSGTSGGATGSGSDSGSSSGSGSATSTMTVAAAQANVDSAQLSVTSAEKAVAATTLRAPMAGTVTAVNGSVGTTVGSGSSSSSSSSSSSGSSSNGASVAGGLGGSGSDSSSSGSSSGSSFITLAQISRFKMEVSLSESDVGSVKVGQPATVTVNAASGEQFAARVTDIGVLSSSSGSGTSSAVSYPVTLSLDQTGKALKAGMSATADVVTSQVTGLAVPSQALTGSTVTVEAADGARTTQQVQTGVVGDSTTQIVSGLKAGDKVVVRSAAAALGAAAGGSDQLNDALRSRAGAGGVGGGLGGAGLAGGGFGGGGGFRGAGGGGGRTP